MSVNRAVTRGRFLKRVAMGSVAFAFSARELIGAGRASAGYYMCEFVDCYPDHTICMGGTLFGIEDCYDAFFGTYCGQQAVALGCCPE